jgi:uncharacterized protein (TIGR00369 family)
MQNQKLALLKSVIGKTDWENPVPVGRWLNGKLLKVDTGKVEIEYIGRPEMNNGLGLVQGGILSAMIDNAMAGAIYSLNGNYSFNTIGLNVEYLFGAKIGEPILAKAAVIKEGKTIIFCECQLFDSAGRILTKASSTLVVK